MTETRFPTITTSFPIVDDGISRHIAPTDRTVYDFDAVELHDDATDRFMALPVRVGTHYGAPTIELGRYSMGLDDARILAALLTKFTNRFEEVDL